MSAGWDVELLKLLQQLGPHLTHLSLWTSETRALLRDPAQIRGPRVRSTLSPSDSEVMSENAFRRQSVSRLLRRLERGTLVQGEALSQVPLKSRSTDDKQRKAEMAAARERAKQTMPKWLQTEMQSRESSQEIKRRYKAQLSSIAREYQHEKEAGEQMRRHMEDTSDKDAHAGGKGIDKFGEVADDSHTSSEEDDDSMSEQYAEWGCMPLSLSICPSLPLHEHEEPMNFARMTIFTRVEELDVYVAIPAEVPRCMELFSGLVASPLLKFRFSSIYSSLLITVLPDLSSMRKQYDRPTPQINVAWGLRCVLRNPALRSLLYSEFNNRRVPDVRLLEEAIGAVIASKDTQRIQDHVCPAEGETKCVAEPATHSSLKEIIKIHRDQALSTVCVRILQGGQACFGKLKDRRQEFLNRTLKLGPDPWQVYCDL